MLLALGEESKRVLNGFPTTLEEDEKLLLDPNNELTMNIRNCIIMRRGEKQVNSLNRPTILLNNPPSVCVYLKLTLT